ncbi:hypothetical protein C8R44DRAFT_864659 [Mycena epipterygia]|nr:hypothetical protein C8R44DRAFT_864659 [Mycena epipterygia]
MPCKAPFHPNRCNYVNDREHDKNPHKHWFLVLGVGLFTANPGRVDADLRDPTPRNDGVHLFFDRAGAERKWDKQCRKRHTHNNEDIVPENSNGSSSSDDGDPSESVDAVKLEAKPEDRPDIPLPLFLDDPTSVVLPWEHTPSLKCTALRAPPDSPKRAKSRSVTKGTLTASHAATPLANAAPSAAADLAHPSVRARPHFRELRINPRSKTPGSPIFMRPATSSVSRMTTPTPVVRPPTSPSAASTPSAAATPAPASRMAASASIASSPSVSSVSSLSTSSVSTAAATQSGLPRLDLHESVSTRGSAAPPFGKGEFGRFFSARGTGASSSSAPSVSRGASTPGGSKGKERAASPTTLLYNIETRTLYKDPGKAVREMEQMESVQLVELDEVMEYMSAGPGRGNLEAE